MQATFGEALVTATRKRSLCLWRRKRRRIVIIPWEQRARELKVALTSDPITKFHYRYNYGDDDDYYDVPTVRMETVPMIIRFFLWRPALVTSASSS